MFRNVLTYCFLASILTYATESAAQDNSNFVVFPTSEIQLNTGQFVNFGQDTDWTEAVRAYTDTSDRAVSVWCNDISASDAAIAVSAKSMSDIGLASCPTADTGNTLTIKVPRDRIPQSYGDLSGLESDHLYLFLRSSNAETHQELSGIGQRLLWEPYKDEAGEIFSVTGGGPKDTFFPNFCQMCGCCTEGIE